MPTIQYTRLYRPKGFRSVVGQEKAKSVLKGDLKKDKISPVLLFYGAYGCGKTTLARIYAKHICCMNYDRENLKTCGECQSCLSFGEGNSVDEHVCITEINSSDSTGVDDIRQLITVARQKPFGGRYRVFILDEVHKLSVPAQNAFLKILEEPPPTTVFLLCTTEAQSLIPTLRSRCPKKLELMPVSSDDIAEYLSHICESESLNVPLDVLKKIGESCDGHVRDAVGMLESLTAMLADGGEATSEMVSEIIKESVIEDPFKISSAFLNNVYRCKAKAALSCLSNLDKTGFYLLSTKCISQMHAEALCTAAGYDSPNSNNFKFRSVCETVGEIRAERKSDGTLGDYVSAMTAMSNDATELFARAKSYATDYDLYSLLVSFAMTCIMRFKGIGKA